MDDTSKPPLSPKPSPTFAPVCITFFCEKYFNFYQILTLSLIFIRILISTIILACGVKIPKDFLKTITLGIFIPILLGALITLYIELANFANTFQTTPDFHTMFIQWTDGLQFIVSDYIHFNTIFLHIIMCHCGKLAYSDDESIMVFPTRMVVSLSQSIPLFLCLLSFIPVTSADSFILRAIRVLNKLYFFLSFLVLLVMIVWCIIRVKSDLPYDHARHSDMQVRDARSRLAFILLYLIIPILTLLPFFVDSIFWLVILISGENTSNLEITSKLALIEAEIKLYSPIWLGILTVTLISPYRRALLIILRCKKIKIEPLPRKEVELTNMYRYANLEEAMEAT